MATTKNLCAQIPIDLHERVSEERERLGQTTSEYLTNLIQEYYDMIENQKGGIQMTEKGRTMAFQIPEELFQRIKTHLARETARTGVKLTQRVGFFQILRFGRRQAGAFRRAGDVFARAGLALLCGRIPRFR